MAAGVECSLLGHCSGNEEACWVEGGPKRHVTGAVSRVGVTTGCSKESARGDEATWKH